MNARRCSRCGREKTPVGRLAVCRPCVQAARRAVPQAKPLPGTELKAILRDWLWIDTGGGCGCNSMAGKMNRRGPDWCESDAGMEEILGSMRKEHSARREAGKMLLPFSEAGARLLVLLACQRSRACTGRKVAV